MESQVLQLGRLNTQVLEGLGRGIDLLVDELALNLVRRPDVPPQQLVHVVRERLQQGLGHVDVAAALDDLAVHQLGDLGHRVVLGAVQLEGLTRGRVVVQHVLQSGSDINGLHRLAWVESSRAKGPYVNRPEALLHVVGGEQAGHSGQFVQEVVLETEHGGRTDNGGLGVDRTSHFLAPSLSYN